jgi:hypothetical protein
MMVPAENGTSKDKNEQIKTSISKPLSKIPHKTGRMKLDGFSVKPEKPSESHAQIHARASLK